MVKFLLIHIKPFLSITALAIPLPLELSISEKMRRILLVDDDPAATETLAVILEMLGQDVLVINDSTRAATAAAEFLQHVAIIDIEMPGVSGFDLALAIRRHAQLRDVAMFALSGWADQSTKLRCREFGFDRFFAKPAPIDQISFALVDYG